MYVNFRQAPSLYFWTQTCRLNPLPCFLELLMSFASVASDLLMFLLDGKREKETQRSYGMKVEIKSSAIVVPSSGGTNSNRSPPIRNTTSSPPRHKILKYAEVEEELFMTLARIDGWMDQSINALINGSIN